MSCRTQYNTDKEDVKKLSIIFVPRMLTNVHIETWDVICSEETYLEDLLPTSHDVRTKMVTRQNTFLDNHIMCAVNEWFAYVE